MTARFISAVAGLAALASVAHAGDVYWTDRGAGQLKKMSFDGSRLESITLSGALNSPGTNLRGVAVDGPGRRLFWADNGADRLLTANVDGSASAILHVIPGGNAFPADVRFDRSGPWLYWCDQARNVIQRSNLSGTEVSDVIPNAAPTGPYFMDLDREGGRIYWGDFAGGSIFRANLDGTARETLLTGNNVTRGVRLDPREGMLYWINRDDRKVHRCPLAAFAGGTITLAHPAVQTLYTNLDTPHGLVLDVPARKLYWADTGTNPGNGAGAQSICRGDFDGSSPLEILATGVEPWDVDLDPRCADYAEWTLRCFRRDASAAETSPEADPDGDGIPNAVEYAFDLSPLRADRMEVPFGLVVIDPDTLELHHTVKYRRRAQTGDLQFETQVSQDLIAWTGQAGTIRETSVVSLEEGTEAVTARSAFSVRERAIQFMRIRVRLGR